MNPEDVDPTEIPAGHIISGEIPAEQFKAAITPKSWWYVLVHDNGPGGPVCPLDGKRWGLQMPVTDGLVVAGPTLLCVHCQCQPRLVYSGATPPTGNPN